MATDELGVPDRAALLGLMAEARELSNRELEETVGFRLYGKRLAKLHQRDLVRSYKDGQMWVHELTDKGWRWCADELTGPLPPRAGSAGGALYAVLGGLRRYLDRSGLALADVFQAGPPAAGQPAPEHAAPEHLAAAPAAAGDAAALVRAAYRRLARSPRDWVRLADLREQLGAVPRQRVDDALRTLSRDRVANLVPQANQHDLTMADRAAAVRVGADDCHLISIEEPL